MTTAKKTATAAGRQAPTVRDHADPNDQTKERVETHPAFAQISVSRPTSSPGAILYGSDFRHQHYISVSIRRSELHRSLSNDRPHPGDELIKVAMTEAQWATFVASPGSYAGVQCTLERMGGAGVPGISVTTNRQAQFQAELARRFERVEGNLEGLAEAIKASGLSGKKQDALLSMLAAAQRDLGPNTEFVADQFAEFMEDTVERAKTEVNAYAQVTLQRAGLAALAAGKGPAYLQLAEAGDGAPGEVLDVEDDAPAGGVSER